MNKKLLVLAVSSALTGTSALADTVNVNVYGRLYPQYEIESAHGATATGDTVSTLSGPANGGVLNSRTGVNTTNSYIGFKGDADVGGGMKGWFQIESRLRFDTGNGTWAGRNSAAGLSGRFGNIFLGNWDTVYKQLGDPVSFLGVSSGNFVSTSATLSELGFSGASGDPSVGSFHLRRTNYVEYDTPTFGGFQFLIGYGPHEAKTNARNQDLLTMGVKWEAGPLYVAFAHEEHNDFFAGSAATAGTLTTNVGTANAHSKDTANRLSFKFNLPSGTELGLDYAQMEWKESGAAAAGRFEKYKRNSASFVVLQKLGNLSLAGSLVRSQKGTCSLSGGTACSTEGLEATQINLGTRYDFSKRVGIFALASKLTNGNSAVYALSRQPSPGADPQMAAVGLIVNF